MTREAKLCALVFIVSITFLIFGAILLCADCGRVKEIAECEREGGKRVTFSVTLGDELVKLNGCQAYLTTTPKE